MELVLGPAGPVPVDGVAVIATGVPPGRWGDLAATGAAAVQVDRPVDVDLRAAEAHAAGLGLVVVLGPGDPPEAAEAADAVVCPDRSTATACLRRRPDRPVLVPAAAVPHPTAGPVCVVMTVAELVDRRPGGAPPTGSDGRPLPIVVDVPAGPAAPGQVAVSVIRGARVLRGPEPARLWRSAAPVAAIVAAGRGPVP